MLSTKDMFSGELTSNTNKTGVGVLFQLDSEGRVIVKTIVGGGAADRTRGTGWSPNILLPPVCRNAPAGSHEVRVGDFITRVDSRDVEREPMAVLKELILGPQGTQVQQNRLLVVLPLPPAHNCFPGHPHVWASRRRWHRVQHPLLHTPMHCGISTLPFTHQFIVTYILPGTTKCASCAALQSTSIPSTPACASRRSWSLCARKFATRLPSS